MRWPVSSEGSRRRVSDDRGTVGFMRMTGVSFGTAGFREASRVGFITVRWSGGSIRLRSGC